MKVLFFAALREQLGCQQLDLQADNVAELRQLLQLRWPEYATELSSERALVAINQALCNDEEITLQDNDEVAFFPPMTGG